MSVLKPVKPYTFSSGAVGKAAEVNNDFDILYAKFGELIDEIANVAAAAPKVPDNVKYVSDYMSLTAAVIAIGGVAVDLVIDTATTCTAITTIPATMKIFVQKSGSINVGVNNLVCNGQFEAGLFQVFTGGGIISGSGFSYVRPEWFGTGLPAMLAAYNIAITGVPLELSSTQTYDMGSVSPGAALLPSINAKLRVIGNGATITMSTNATGQTHLFDLINPVYAKFENITFSDAGADISQTWRGAHFVYVSASGFINGYGNIVFTGVKTTSGVSPLTVFGTSATSRIENIKFEGGCVFTNTYYGPLFQNQGDNFTGEWTCNNCRRAYYSYGVRNHSVDIKVYHGGVAYPGSDGAIEITSSAIGSPAQIQTHGIRVRAAFTGSLANYSNCVNFVLIGNAGPTYPIINDIHVDLSLTDATWTSSTYPVAFSGYDTNGGVLQATWPVNSWGNIHLTGDFFKTDLAHTIKVNTVQAYKGWLTVDNMRGVSMSLLAGFNTSYTSSDDGIWTLTDGSGAALVFTAVVGEYMRVGSAVIANFTLTYPVTTNTAFALWDGLPFLSGSQVGGGSVVYTDSNLSLSLVLNSASTAIWPFIITGIRPTNAQLSGKTIRGTVIYRIP